MIPLSFQKLLIRISIAAGVLLSACGGLGAATEAPVTPPAEPTVETPTEAPSDVAPTPAEVQPTAASPAAGPVFALAGAGAVNRDVAQAGQSPAVTLGALTPGGPSTLWITWSENASGGLRNIFVSELDASGAFQPRGTSLNLHLNVAADQPTITFAGENNAVPWVAWAEPSPGFGDVVQVFASRFNAATGLWQPAGQDRGSNEPSLNLNTDREATHPFIFGGSGDPASPPVPWIAWEELSARSNFVQIFVAKGVKDETGIGGFVWEAVGPLNKQDEPSLNVDPNRDALHPVAVFAETGNAVPWVTWHEIGADRPARVFTARGVADAKAPGGFRWVLTPACTPDETTCALNVNPLKDAKDATMAAGSLNAGEAAVPWIAWAEIGPTGKWQIFVSKLDTATRNSFVNVGGSLNVDQNRDARAPFITFIKNVPYVAWLEDDGSGKFKVQVRHLASDVQTGTWVLDTPAAGFSKPGVSGLFAASSPEALFMAWAEGDPASEAAQVVAGHLKP